jgi:adenylate cyclase
MVCALNADVVGYSRLFADDFEGTSLAMSGARHVVETRISEHRGHLVNFVGDNFMAVFERATDAVQTAIAVASALEDANIPHPTAQWLRFRMGIDRGEVTVSDGHYEGDALNIAARIQALAKSGGLSVSGSVYRELDEPELRFRPIGAQRLKNIPELVEIYEFVDLPTHAIADAGSRLALEIPTIAVLPIHVEGVDDNGASAGTVIRGDLIHRLSSIPELIVVDAADPHAGQQRGAGARYILETGVHQAGDRLRVHATVLDVATMNVVKAHKLTGTVSDVFDLSDALSEQIGHTIEVELVVGAPAGLYSELNDPGAIEKVYMGWYHLRSDTPEGWQKALGLFGEVAESHPDLPYGWVLSAFANWVGAANGWSADPAASLAMAREQADRGRTIGDPTGLAQTVDAAVLMSMGRIDEAVEAVGRVEITRPTCDVTFGLEGSLKRYLGDWEEAVDLLDTAMRLTGINKPWYPTVKACSLFIGNKTEQAASVAESVLEYQPNNVEALLVLVAAQVELGLDRRAEATASIVRERFPSLDVEAWLDRNPYQDQDLMDRWKADLTSVDLIGAS